MVDITVSRVGDSNECIKGQWTEVEDECSGSDGRTSGTMGQWVL